MLSLFLLLTSNCMSGNSSCNEEAAAVLLSATSVRTREHCHEEETAASLTLTLAALATFSHVGHGRC